MKRGNPNEILIQETQVLVYRVRLLADQIDANLGTLGKKQRLSPEDQQRIFERCRPKRARKPKRRR